MKFIALGKYNSSGLSGFVKNPTDDRTSAINSMFERAEAKMTDLFLH